LTEIEEALRYLEPLCKSHFRSPTEDDHGPCYHLARGYEPFVRRHAMDVVMIDLAWNGLSESRRIAELAGIHDLPVTPHNYYSHLSTFMSAHFSAAVPNAREMEVDIDDVPWKDDLVTVQPEIKDGYMTIPTAPGWGTDLNEEALKAHLWKTDGDNWKGY